MFTGIVERRGKIREVCDKGSYSALSISVDGFGDGVVIGESISVNGVCLTVTKKDKGSLSFDVMGQTMKETALRNISGGDEVNLERALKAGDRLGGHFVTGHIDCIGRIIGRRETEDGLKLDIVVPVQLLRFIVDRGSVAIDGVSLTVAEKNAGSFAVFIIPHTAALTGLGSKRSGEVVNIEFDMLGKYALAGCQGGTQGAITTDFLRENGFLR